MDICRTCMSEGNIQFVPVYSKLNDMFIADIIMECTAIQIQEQDGLPTHICYQCMDTLKQLSVFVRTVRDCDQHLRKMYHAEYKQSPMVDQTGLMAGSSKVRTIQLEKSDTDEFQFAEVKIEPLGEALVPEEEDLPVEAEAYSEGSEAEYYDEGDAASDGENSESDSETSSSSNSDSEWKHGYEDDEQPVRVRKKPGPKPKPRPSNTESRPLLNRRRPKNDDDLEMNDYEYELYTVINIERNKHICCGCLLIFDTAQELELHRGKFHVRKRESNSLESNSSKVLCDGCLRKYKSKRRVNYHKERVRQLTIIWECNKCKNRFSEATRRRSHANKHPRKAGPTAIVAPIKEVVQQELGWICCAQACAQSFPSERALIDHAGKAHQINKQEAELEENQDKKVQCQVCYRRFHDKNGLINHQQRLYRLHKFQCALCGLQFNSGGRLTEHELTHQSEKPFKCEECGKAFTQKGNLKTHMSVHTNEKPFQCTVCGMAFRQKGGLKTHMSNHVENPQFKCEVCSKMFKAKLHLRYHMRIHNGERPFPCRYCEKAFTDFTNRMRHEMSHTGIKPYKCSYCEKSFIRKRFLLEHESTHTGVKMYNCDVCHQSFGQKNSLKKHMQNSHPTFGGSSQTAALETTAISPSGVGLLPGHHLPPQTHPISLTSQQHQQLLAVFQQPH